MAAMAMGSAARAAVGQSESRPPVRIGVIGLGNRGRALLRLLLRMPSAAVTALCDMDEGALARAGEIVRRETGRQPAGYSGKAEAYRDLLGDDRVDAVLVATPTKWHCSMSVAAMKAGKHVGSEVPAGFSIEELWQLVETKEATGRRYMLLENYIYTRPNMMVYNMARQGVFGETYYAECAYIHDCRFMLFKQDGSLDWWGEWASRNYGHDYPTHGLGPVSKWLGLNEGDRMTQCCAMMSRPRVLAGYTRKRFGPESPQARIEWKNGDFTSVMIETADGRLIRTDYDVNSPRPMSNYHLLQGTQGVYDSRAGFYFDGAREAWEPAEAWYDRYDHPDWRQSADDAARSGHGGGDYFAVRDFVDMARQDCEPWIDVYDAASWSAIYHCSRLSIDRRGASVEVPDFTRGRWRQRDWRKPATRPV